MTSSCTQGGSGWMLGKTGNALEQATWEGANSTLLELFKNNGDIALRDKVSGHDGNGLGLP